MLKRKISPFGYLNATQFLGALNDNVFKWVMIFLLMDVLGADRKESILALSGAIYVLPFLLFSIAAGTLADRLSKNRIILFTKVLEIGVMMLGVFSFATRSVFGTYATLFLMSAQSALFSPSKYGIVRELVPIKELTRANGLLTAFTVLSIIAGTVVASSLTDLTHRNFTIIGIVCVVIAILGTLTALGIGHTPSVGAHRSISLFPLAEIWGVLKRARGESYLIEALLGSSFFFFIGAFVQLNIVPFAMDSLGLTDTQGGYLFFCSSLGIALGAVASGKVCGRYVELGLGPIAGMGMASMLLLMALLSSHLYWVLITIFLTGFFAGLFLVPYDAFIQVVSPDRHRGQNLATGNFLGFVAILGASGCLALFSALHLSPEQGFICMAALCTLVALLYTLRSTDTFVRLLGRAKLRHFSRNKNIRLEEVSSEQPVLFLASGMLWWRAIPLLAGCQQRYTRFLVERPFPAASRGGRWTAWLAKTRFYDRATLDQSFDSGCYWLRRGYNLMILPSEPNSQVTKELMQRLSAEAALHQELVMRPLTISIEGDSLFHLAQSIGPTSIAACVNRLSHA